MEEKNFSVIKDLKGYFEEGQRKAIYEAAESHRDKVLIRLLWVTGRRISEILNVRISEINLTDNHIAFHIEKKTEKVDGIRRKKDLVKLKPIDIKTSAMIKSYIEEVNLRHSQYLFESPFKPGFPISRQRAFEIVRTCAAKAGISKVGDTAPHPHHFRHTYAIDMAKKLKTPGDLRKLQMIMEHANLAVTEQYLQFADWELREMVEEIGD
jgi:integrase/recombinase XerD